VVQHHDDPVPVPLGVLARLAAAGAPYASGSPKVVTLLAVESRYVLAALSAAGMPALALGVQLANTTDHYHERSF